MRTLLHETVERIADYRATLPDARVYPKIDVSVLRSALGGDAPLAEEPTSPEAVIAELDGAVPSIGRAACSGSEQRWARRWRRTPTVRSAARTWRRCCAGGAGR